MASIVYNRAKKEIADGTMDLLTDTLKVMLVTSTYVADPDHDFVDMGGASDPIDTELSGTGYQAGFAATGRKTLANKAIAEDDPNNRAEFDNTVDLTWTAINAGTAAAFIVYKHLTSDAASVLIAYVDTGTGLPTSPNSGDIEIQWSNGASSIFQL